MDSMGSGGAQTLRNELGQMDFSPEQIHRAIDAGCVDANEATSFLFDGVMPRGRQAVSMNLRDASARPDESWYAPARPASPSAVHRNAAHVARPPSDRNNNSGGGGGSASGSLRSNQVTATGGGGQGRGTGGGGSSSTGDSTAGKKSKGATLLSSLWGGGGSSAAGDGKRKSSPARSVSSSASARGFAGRRVTIQDEQHDADMERAIKLSTQEASLGQDGVDAKELRAALEQSKAEATMGHGGGRGLGGDGGDDVELRRAIEQSMREQHVRSSSEMWGASDVNPDPRDRRRSMGGGVKAVGDAKAVAATPGVRSAEPVGLRNVGNTCYLNSLLQVYFHLTDFRRRIYSFTPSPHVTAALAAARSTPGVVSTVNAVSSVGPTDDLRAMVASKSTLNAASDHFARSNEAKASSTPVGLSGSPGGNLPAPQNENTNESKLCGEHSAHETKPLGTAVEGRREAESRASLSPAQVYSVEFVIELQRLFARMALGNQKYADPSDLLKTMRDTNGKPIVIGDQQDASEFNSLFLDIVERALATSSSSDEEAVAVDDGAAAETACASVSVTDPECTASSGMNVVKRMFSANFCQRLSLIDPALAAVTPPIQPKHGSTYALNIDATSEVNRDLYSGLDDFTRAKIDYKVSKSADPDSSSVVQASLESDAPCSADTGAAKIPSENPEQPDKTPSPLFTPATKSVWFTHFAPVLTICLSRFRYNRRTSQAEKVHARFAFETEIAVDRYLEVNREFSERARATVEKIRRDRASTERALAQLSRFPELSPRKERPSKEDVDMQSTSVGHPDSTSGATAATTMVIDMEDVMRKDDVMATRSGVAAIDEKSSPRATAQSPKVSVDRVDDISTVFARARLRAQAAVSSVPGDGRAGLIVPGMSARDRDTLVELLDMIAVHDRIQMENYRNEIAALVKDEAAAYADIDKTMYSLHAVLVHDGESSSGHYWAYIRNKNSLSEGDRWLKFSDLVVSPVSESEMLAHSLGGTGFASAYFLIYVRKSVGHQMPHASAGAGDRSGEMMEVDTFAPSGPAKDFMDIFQESRDLLPKARLEEVEAWNLAFEEEVKRFEAQETMERRTQRARSIVQDAVESVNESTNSLRGLRLAEFSAKTGLVDVVPRRTSGTRSLIEFCIAIGARPLALTQALCRAWADVMCDAEEGERDLLTFVGGRGHILAAYPPLPGAPDSKESAADTNDDDELSATLLINEIARHLREFGKLFPADVSQFSKEELLSLCDALSGSQHLHRVHQAAKTSEAFYLFALRAQCLATAAYSAALRGLLGECMGLYVILLRQDICIFVDTDGNSTNSDVEHASKFISDANMSLGRRDEEALRFLPSILRAVQLRLASSYGQSAEGSSLLQHDAERNALAVHLRDLRVILQKRASGKRGSAAMAGNTKLSDVSEDHALKVNYECMKRLNAVDPSHDIFDSERARARTAVQLSTQRAASALATNDVADLVHRYESLRDALCDLKCDAFDEDGATMAGQALLNSMSKTAAA